MATNVSIPTRLQLETLCKGDQGLIRAFELLFFGIQQIPSLEDGVDNNTLAISTLSDLVRPITINLIQPLSAQISANTTYMLTGGEGTEGMKTILIPAAFLVASAGGPFILTISAGAGNTVLIPIAASGDTIVSGDLVFDVHLDGSGNVITKAWSISGQNGNGTWVKNYEGIMLQSGAGSNITTSTSSGSATVPFFGTQTITFPCPSIGNNPEVSISSLYVSGTIPWAGRYQTITLSSFLFVMYGGTNTDVATPTWKAISRWRT